jgi:SMI1 / KNR4 family (SUKH-1)
MTDTSKLSLKELVDDLYHTYLEILKYMGIEVETRLLPGATEAAISKFEKDRKVRFPPSYRKFLRLHNGWIGFLGDYSLVGVSDFEEALNSIDMIKAEFARCWAGNRHSTDPKYIADYEAGGAKRGVTLADAHIYLPTKTVFGVGYMNHFLVFDDRPRTPDGEMEVLHVTPEWEVGNRYTNFEQMLRDYSVIQHDQLQEHIDYEHEEQAKKEARNQAKKPRQKR